MGCAPTSPIRYWIHYKPKGEHTVKLDDIRTIARDMGLKPGKLNKIQLVRNIQREEGNFDCFATAASGCCDQGACLWREDCLTTTQKSSAA